MSSNRSYGLPPSTQRIDFSKKVDLKTLKDQSVLVTGGASGIGEAFVGTLAEAGAYVTILDLHDDKGQAVVEGLTNKGYKVQFIQGDVRSWDDQVSAFDAAIAFSPFHALDIVMPIAGITGQNILEWLKNPTSSDGKLVKPDTRTIDINLTAVWYTTHLAFHYFRQSLQKETRSVTSKQILFVSSLAGYFGNPYSTSYCASKWGVRGIWRTIRNENALLGNETSVKFRTSLLAPWFVKTGLTEPLMPALTQLGIPFAKLDDCIDAMLRIVCDDEVKGRAIAVAPDGKNFDLCDDVEGMDAGKELNQKIEDGVFHTSFKAMHDFYSARE